MNEKVLFIGFADCEYCQKAYEFLKLSNFQVDWLKASKKRREKLPPEYVNWNGDYIFHMKSYYILPKTLLDGASKAAINFHPGSPDYPGSGCVNWALYNNETRTAITVHHLNERIDNGEIIKVFWLPIATNDDIQTVLPRVHMHQLFALCQIADALANRGIDVLDKFKKQVIFGDIKWSNKVGRIRDIDRLQLVDENTSQEELERIIRATAIGRFGPTLKLHGHEFRYYKEKQ